MQNRVKLIFLGLGVFIFLLAAVAIAEDFSADIVSTTKEGTMQGKVFVSQDKARMEFPEATSISRMDKQLVWLLMPAQKMYMEQPLDPSKIVATSDQVKGELERKPVGQEMIDGTMTNKYEVVYEAGGKKDTMFQWLAVGSNIPVKTAAADNSWVTEFKNIVTGTQPDDLFEVPAGYQKFSAQMPSLKDILGQ